MALTILLIDDNPSDRVLIIRELRREFDDLEVEQVIDAAGLSKALAAGRFDLVITDYFLRWSDGLTVLEQIKQQYPDCPVVMFTNSGNEEIAVAAMKGGVDDYVIKSPRHYLRLRTAVRSVWQRTRAQQRAEALEQELTTLLERLSVGFFRVTLPQKRLIACNRSFFELLGIPEDLERARVLLVERWQHLELPETRDCWKWSPQTSVSHEVELNCADGRAIWVRLNYSLGQYEGESVIDGLVEDISQRKQIEQERLHLLERERVARAAAERASRIKDEFLATVSHELRTPLNAIMGWSQLLQGGKLDGDRQQQAISIVERNARAQSQLIEDLLDLSRIIRGQMKLQIQEIDLCVALKAALETVMPAANAKQMQLDWEPQPNPPKVQGDRERLQQVFWNLLVNAVKFTPTGGKIAVRLYSTPEQVCVEIADSGQGISCEALPHIFERFRQEDNTPRRSQGGLGLGLAIVKQLVELHGGTVSAHSEGLGQGATFTVTIPRSDRPHWGAPSPDPEIGTSLEGVQLMVVEDEADTREMMVLMLQARGAEVTAAASVKEALILIDSWRPDVLIGDLAMPEEDGLALMTRLRDRDRARGEEILPAIAVTAYSSEQVRQQALQAGYLRQVTKPIDVEQLVRSILEILPTDKR